MKKELASINQEGEVSVITLDDGKANVFSIDMIKAVDKLLDKVPVEKGSLLITGREGMFSGGFDLKVMAAGNIDDISNMVKAGFTLLARIYGFPRPVVIACSGHGIALGAFLLCCADYRFGAKGDFIIGANEVRNKMSVPAPILEISKSRIVKTHWFRAILNAEMYPISKAVEPGYLDEVVEAEALISKALEKANDLATLDHPGYKITKDLDQVDILGRINKAING
ncbi:MAG: crotonase/enoyl-CoA hydratase family protein [SAR86 cluster bacterium]|nr:crotonase/enoyl-CoA hydratase family protein [SAR86 cluster bacterium]